MKEVVKIEPGLEVHVRVRPVMEVLDRPLNCLVVEIDISGLPLPWGYYDAKSWMEDDKVICRFRRKGD